MSFLFSTAAMADQSGYRAWIETRPEGNGVRVLPYVETRDAANLRYELLTAKQGKAGSATTRQAGSVQTVAAIPKPLSNLFLNFDGGDSYRLALRIYDRNGTLLAEEFVQQP